MIISDKVIFHILSILKDKSPIDNIQFTALLEKELINKNIPHGHLREKLKKLKFTVYNEKNKTILITSQGRHFIIRQKIKNFTANPVVVFIIILVSLILSIIFNLDKIIK